MVADVVPARRSGLRRLAGLIAGLGAVAGVGLGLVSLYAARHIEATAGGRVFSVDAVPATPVAMVLGAKAYPGWPSASLGARLDLVVELWRLGRIRAVLVSGDGTADSNHETRVMRDYLVDHGVPADRIVEDPAGFDTYDSCVRARDVFGVTSMVILTQDYHLPRAITTCVDVGVEAVGVPDVTFRERYPAIHAKGAAREWLANLKMVWDVATRRSPQPDPFDPTLLEAAGLR